MSLADLRRSYTLRSLQETDVSPNPFVQFRVWFDEALAAQLTEPNAMTLATVNTDGIPSARVVLLKGFDERGFVFYTNYESRKAHELIATRRAALVFYWAELERQVRVEGEAAQVDPAEADAYFHSRPQGSQLGAHVSPQSQVISSRAVLEHKLQELTATYAEQTIPRPEHWGGFRVVPTVIEFWQGRPNRLHDRLRYRRADQHWIIERLAP